MADAKEPTIYGLTRANLDAQLESALKRKDLDAEAKIRVDMRLLETDPDQPEHCLDCGAEQPHYCQGRPT